MVQGVLQFAPSTQTAPRSFLVKLWRPEWNREDRNFGSRVDDTVTSTDRTSAIHQAFANRYYDGKELPTDADVVFDTNGKYFVAFRPFGPAVGKAFLVKAARKGDIWDGLYTRFGWKPAWVEPITASKV
jgi:hypothetical protein